MKIRYYLLALLATCSLLTITNQAEAKCNIKDIFKSHKLGLHDPLFIVLNSLEECPKNVLEFKAILKDLNTEIIPTMVSNRGFHNSNSGSLSIFEMVKGNINGIEINSEDFYFGHFTGLNKTGDLFLLQEPRGLMIELEVWDPKKQVYNFYELIGDSSEAHWFYRGDSFDILDDVKNLHLQKDPSKPVFGKKLRCSGCHTSGSPIMKELEGPHNAWWTQERIIPLEGLKPDENVSKILSQLVDANELSSNVKKSIRKLEASAPMQKFKSEKLTLQELLRPLFATVEINFESDKIPLSSPANFVEIPSTYWLDPRLGSLTTHISKESYIESLIKSGQFFPESGQIDSDHAWLAPVKSFSDIQAIETLLKSNFLDENFVFSVLAVDWKKPIFSDKRRSLLTLIPLKQTKSWREEFLKNIEEAAKSNNNLLQKNAAEEFLTYYRMSIEEIKLSIQKELKRKSRKLMARNGVTKELIRLKSKRLAIATSEISKNPLGQILEPGFRVIFPEIPKKDCNDLLK